METEEASHEAQERLTSASPKTLYQTEHQVAKVQNGNQLSGGFPKQVNGDVSWNHFKSYTAAGQMKRYRETCSGSAGMQEMFDQCSYLTNGEANHAFREPLLLETPQSKKLKVDLDNKRKEDDVMLPLDETKPVDMESNLGCFSHFSKKVEFDCDVLLEQKQDKESCVLDDDIFSLPRNKPVVPNGAILTSPSTKGPHGDLIEKPPCQYYPDHLSHSPHDPTFQENATKHLSAEGMPLQAMCSPSLTSGLPILPQISTSGQLDEVSLHLDSNAGYSVTLTMDPKQLRGQDGPFQDVPEAAAAESLSEDQEGLVCRTKISTPQNQNSTERLLNHLHPSNIGRNSRLEFKESFSRCPPHIDESKSSSPSADQSLLKVVDNKLLDVDQTLVDINPSVLSQKCQQQMEFGIPQQSDSHRKRESCSLQSFAGSDQSSFQPTPAKLIDDVQNLACNSGPQACLVGNRSQQERLEGEQAKGEEVGGMSKPERAYCSVKWIELNSSPPPNAWKDYGSEPQHRHDSLDSLGISGSMQAFQMQDLKPTNVHHQDKHTSGVYKSMHDQNSSCVDKDSEMQPNKVNPLSSQCSQQHESRNLDHTQIKQEHLWVNTQKNTEQILTSDFPDHQQSLEQQIGSAIQQELSQDALGVGTTQMPSQRSMEGQLLDESNMKVYFGQEKHPKPLEYKSQNQQMQYQAGLHPSTTSKTGSLNAPLQNTQTHHDMTTAYKNANGAALHDSHKFDKTMEMNHQLEYYPSHKVKNQCLQVNIAKLLSNHTGVQELSPTLMNKHFQLSQGASHQQEPEPAVAQVCIKAEQKESCSQLQGQLREFQKHTALRMHLLQKQRPQNLNNFKHLLQAIKNENGPKLESLGLQQGCEMPAPTPQAVIKQERSQVACEQFGRKSILATMERQLSQYHLPSNFLEDKSLDMKLANNVKVETSGHVTILSMHANPESKELGGVTQKRSPSDLANTKKMSPSLCNFLESPIKLLDTPIKNLLETPMKTQYEIPSCHCVEQISERDEGPYYTHLGAAPNVAGIRELMEKRFGQTGSSIRIEKVVYTGKEGKSTQGCPIAKWVIRRASVEEKVLVLVRERAGHTCSTAAMVVAILIWEGISTSLADHLYTELSDTLTRHGALTNRRCALNEERTCACQGLDLDRGGASFSFGCSWSMYYNGCKFARSKFPRKFKLLGDDPKEEEKIEQHLQNLATLLAPKYKQMAPDAYANQVEHENRALSCRLGMKEGRPFSGVTACLDFCAHSHRDLHNMQGGSTVVCTLTREDNREIRKIPEDEQLHVLPLYKISQTDEFGSVEGQESKVKSGAIQVLTTFRRQVRMRSEPAKSCRQRKLEGKRGGANKPLNPDTPNSKAEKTLQAKIKQENSGHSTPVPGPQPGQGQIGAAGVGHQPQPLSVQHQHQHQQQQQQQISNPASPHPVQHNYPRIPNHTDPFLGSSQPNAYCKSPAGIGSYLSPLHVANPHINGSHPRNSYPRTLNPANIYPGYQVGSLPVDTYSPIYPPNPKHLNMLQQQRPPFLSQQLAAPPQYGVNYSPRYGDPGAQMNNFRPCDMTPKAHTMGSYPAFGSNGKSDPQFLERMPQSPSPHLEYGSLSKHSQYGGSYLAESCKMLPPGQDSFRMQSMPEMSLHNGNGMSPSLPLLRSECTSFTPPRFGCPNGSTQETPEKQEGGGANTAEKEELWSDNEHNFLDPEIGGVAIAPSHGSILIECAKRELHATTPLKKPDRNHPTRISLVFYQHKNLNEAKHGLALWEAKMAEKAREKEEDPEKHGSDSTPTKNKKVKREPLETLLLVEPQAKHFNQTPTQSSMSCTTNTYINTAPFAFTKTTGPYNRFI